MIGLCSKCIKSYQQCQVMSMFNKHYSLLYPSGKIIYIMKLFNFSQSEKKLYTKKKNDDKIEMQQQVRHI